MPEIISPLSVLKRRCFSTMKSCRRMCSVGGQAPRVLSVQDKEAQQNRFRGLFPRDGDKAHLLRFGVGTERSPGKATQPPPSRAFSAPPAAGVGASCRTLRCLNSRERPRFCVVLAYFRGKLCVVILPQIYYRVTPACEGGSWSVF